MEEQLKANSMLMQEYEKSFGQRLKEAKENKSEVSMKFFVVVMIK